VKPSRHSTTINYKLISNINLHRIVDKKNPFVLLSKAMNWLYLEKTFDNFYDSKIGRPAISTRLMITLHFLRYAFDMSDREILRRWTENVYWQFFSGMDFMVYGLPIHHSTMSAWRKRVGVCGIEKLVTQTIKVGLNLKLIDKKQLEDINIDTTIQEKFIHFPTDSRLYYDSIKKLIKTGKKIGIEFSEDYEKFSKYFKNQLLRVANLKDLKKISKKLKNYLRKILNDFNSSNLIFTNKTKKIINLCTKVYLQKKRSKNKIYSLHAPEVECITKGKYKKKHKFGNKVCIAVTSLFGWIVAVKSFHGNPYDGHTLDQIIKKIDEDIKFVKNIYVDMGFKGHNYFGQIKVYFAQLYKKEIPDELWRKIKRRSAIEPTIGHLKAEHRMNYNKLKGKIGDCINPILSAAGMNFKKLINALSA